MLITAHLARSTARRAAGRRRIAPAFIVLLGLGAVAATKATAQEERFVPGGPRAVAAATLEVRPEVQLTGAEVRLRHICRWSSADKAAFEPIGDLVLLRLRPASPYRAISVDELKQTLAEAGVNLAMIRLAGATSCTISRTDVKFDERSALEEWIAAREAPATRPTLIEPGKASELPGAPAALPAAEVVTGPATRPRAAEVARGGRTLRDILMSEAAERLNLPAEQLQFYFNPADEKLLSLGEPFFRFNVKTPRNRNLGEVTWELSIVNGDASQKAQITATVKAWQCQLVVSRPLGYRQIITEEDLVDRRALVDALPEDPLITRQQAVGQMASRDLKPGTLMTARLIEATLMVKTGQLVTVLMTHGTIQAKTVARATEQGTMGQTIRVKNEGTGSMVDVVITGPQAGRLAGGTN